LFQERVILVAPDGFVDLGKTRRQIVQFFLQPGEITVCRMELLPQLRLEPKNMILPRRLALKKSLNDRCLGFLIGQRSRYEILFNVFHNAILLA